ncbi:6640_t:CDS:2 [Entrophospora sp. SA101]|nr:6640_t:CDS:2 [Entrophospora sp. SA101]CAJ0823012.1 13198_t:CDS:2 [Entrophospora sp. SA101]
MCFCSREFNHRVKSILASTFTPAEIESLKNGGNAWVDFPEPDPSDIESIRTLMSMKYKQKKWLDESLLKANNKRPPNALNNKLNNSSSNLSDDFSSQHSSLNGHSPVSPTSRKSDNNTSYLKYSSDTYNVVVSPSTTTNNIPMLPKPNSNNLISLSSGPNNNTCNNNVKNELDDFFDTLNNSSNQQSITKRNNTYLESNKISTTTNAFFTQQNSLDNGEREWMD